jgi:hypothetical protein
MDNHDSLPGWVWIVLFLAAIAMIGAVVDSEHSDDYEIRRDPTACPSIGRYTDC